MQFNYNFIGNILSFIAPQKYIDNICLRQSWILHRILRGAIKKNREKWDFVPLSVTPPHPSTGHP